MIPTYEIAIAQQEEAVLQKGQLGHISYRHKKV